MDYSNYENILSGVNKILYKTSRDFMLSLGVSPEEAHNAGLEKIGKVKELSKKLEQPQVYVDLSTGIKFLSKEH